MAARHKSMTGYGWPRAHLRLAVALAVVVLLAAGGLAYHFWPRHAQPVYVTDGSYVFNTNLSKVERLIHQENAWVTSTGRRYVSIAVLATMSPQPGVEPLDANQTRHGLEGAYLAQYEANHPSGPPPARLGAPLVRLLLADDGSQEGTWSEAADAVAHAAADGQHLVAVTGLGTSPTNLLHALSAKHIAMVGSVSTADGRSGITGLVRVSPTDTDEARAAVRFLNGDRALPATPRVWVMQDENSADDYATSLGAAFPQALISDGTRHYQIVGPGTEYDSSMPSADALLSAQDSGGDVCRSNVDVVYFAGRGVDLRGALGSLAHRRCAASRHLTVLTGDDATRLAGAPSLWPGASANMDVYYTGLAYPDLPGFGHMFAAEGKAALDDGWAIMFHDGVLTAVDAVHKASGDGASTPDSVAVAQHLTQVTVHGASGYLCFDDSGNPIGKAIPIVQVSQHGSLTYRTGSATSANPCA